MTTPPTVDADLGWTLGTVMRSYMKLSEHALAGVPGGPRSYLVLTAAANGELGSQLAIAQHLNIDRTVMTYLLDDLENEGLVERKPDPADRRARRVLLTDAGRELLCTLERRLRQAEEALLGPLDGGEREVLRSLLRRIATDDGGHRGSACDVAERIVAEDAVAAVPTSRRRRS
ncbi:MarR family winged helix-turn-helix transcriptional regulator [Pseudonocardia sp. GCM10023141]|uniref:MarR family winged helix-turn-helix transcriptional regulator n=1 Tax=Pseudonocardia sp. GCM10023141 TaxID=3252653 RepID=UPI003622F580